jgi:hypothetical protein
MRSVYSFVLVEEAFVAATKRKASNYDHILRYNTLVRGCCVGQLLAKGQDTNSLTRSSNLLRSQR